MFRFIPFKKTLTLCVSHRPNTLPLVAKLTRPIAHRFVGLPLAAVAYYKVTHESVQVIPSLGAHDPRRSSGGV